MVHAPRITSPHDAALAALATQLSEQADALDASGAWPAEQLAACGRYGVYEWFLPRQWGGQEWTDADAVRGYLRLSAACLTTTFIITQRTGACQRIAMSDNESLKAKLLPDLASGARFATLGISHLTTSRRHLGKPPLAAEEDAAGFRLDGFSPWVTGGAHADVVVTGAVLPDGRQILLTLPSDARGLSFDESVRLTGVSASHTGRMHCAGVSAPREWLLAGPVENVMSQTASGGTGGLQTSTLAIGLSAAALDFLAGEAQRRADLVEPTTRLRAEQAQLAAELIALADGREPCTLENLRTRANSLVLRATQAALAAAKGTGYVVGHPAGRWCREALFFLVWSCPQPVMNAALCEFAGLAD